MQSIFASEKTKLGSVTEYIVSLLSFVFVFCQNFDNIVNDHGKQLLDLCKTCDLRILNGRSKGDTLGKFTFQTKNVQRRKWNKS